MIDTSHADTRQEKVKIITDTLEKGIKDLFDSEKYKEYLSKMSRLHNYSFNNTMLILLQKPDATMVASITAWNKDFHRYVNKGEHGITILAPCNYKKPTAKPLFDKDGNPEKDENGSPLYCVEYVNAPLILSIPLSSSCIRRYMPIIALLKRLIDRSPSPFKQCPNMGMTYHS